MHWYLLLIYAINSKTLVNIGLFGFDTLCPQLLGKSDCSRHWEFLVKFHAFVNIPSKVASLRAAALYDNFWIEFCIRFQPDLTVHSVHSSTCTYIKICVFCVNNFGNSIFQLLMIYHFSAICCLPLSLCWWKPVWIVNYLVYMPRRNQRAKVEEGENYCMGIKNLCQPLNPNHICLSLPTPDIFRVCWISCTACWTHLFMSKISLLLHCFLQSSNSDSSMLFNPMLGLTFSWSDLCAWISATSCLRDLITNLLYFMRFELWWGVQQFSFHFSEDGGSHMYIDDWHRQFVWLIDWLIDLACMHSDVSDKTIFS